NVIRVGPATGYNWRGEGKIWKGHGVTRKGRREPHGASRGAASRWVWLEDAVLARDGHNVILEKIEDWNVVELMVNEEVVFHCNIKDLEFGGDGKLDPLCEEARIAVLNAY
uniref:Uncharacterized protein n=1 Tax=Felis catus TaxID=9685 RepID=A0ABI7WQY7_FELCA